VTRLGVDNAKRLFLTAQKISAPEMLRIGYLTAMVPVEFLDEEVDKLAPDTISWRGAVFRAVQISSEPVESK